MCRLIKGGYERNPPKPRYSSFWDVNVVFKLLKSWGPTNKLTLKNLSLKLVMLLLLVSSQRGQTVMNLSTEDLRVTNSAVFRMKVLLKHNRQGDPLDTLILRPYDACKRLCVVRTLKRYLRLTEEVRKHKQLLLSFMKPFGPVSRDTISRWTLKVLQLAGIDIAKYKSHSTRGASTSAAKRLGVPVAKILKQASWRNEHSFAKYYDKDIDSENADMARMVLNNVA